LNVPINDIVTSALSTAMHKVFEDNKDKSKDIGIIIPANIRFEFYKSREHIKMENKFSVLPMRIPLVKEM